MDFSIILASRKDTQGLWLTIHSIELELAQCERKYEYEYCIVTNDGDVHPDLKTLMYHVKQAGHLNYCRHFPKPVSAPTARQIATENAQGKILFFFDSHVLVTRGYFDRAFETFEQYNPDILHTTTKFYVSDKNHYHYRLHLTTTGWGEAEDVIASDLEPYRIASAGHGAFAAQKQSWEDIGGYWKGFKEYAGEENYTSLKAAMLDKTVWLDPQWYHWHYCGDRGYRRHYTDQFFVNNMMAMNILGGEKYANKVYEHFDHGTVKIRPKKPLFELYEEALQRSAKHAEWLASVRKRDLEAQLEYFRQNNIPF